MFEVYLSWSFCDKCPRARPIQSHHHHPNQNHEMLDDEEQGDSDLDAPHTKYSADQTPHQQPQQRHMEDTRHRSPREAPREKTKSRKRRRPRKRNAHQKQQRSERTVSIPTPTMQTEEQRNFSDVCNICWMRERRRDHRIESIKKSVLDKLEMEHAPNISRPALPEVLPPGIFGNGVLNTSNMVFQSNRKSHLDDADETTQIVHLAKPRE